MSIRLNENFEERIDKEVEYICDGGYTLREVAKLTGVSKSTVHIDVTVRLKEHSYTNYLKVKDVLDEHLATRHLRGGEATRKYYERLKEMKF